MSPFHNLRSTACLLVSALPFGLSPLLAQAVGDLTKSPIPADIDPDHVKNPQDLTDDQATEVKEAIKKLCAFLNSGAIDPAGAPNLGEATMRLICKDALKDLCEHFGDDGSNGPGQIAEGCTPGGSGGYTTPNSRDDNGNETYDYSNDDNHIFIDKNTLTNDGKVQYEEGKRNPDGTMSKETRQLSTNAGRAWLASTIFHEYLHCGEGRAPDTTNCQKLHVHAWIYEKGETSLE